MVRFIILTILSSFIYLDNVKALTVCSQNLHRLGEKDYPGSSQYEKQKNYLISRIASAECDIVALQELTTSNNKGRDQILKNLSDDLSSRLSGKNFKYLKGKTSDNSIGNAFIYNDRALELEDSYSLHNRPLPKFSPRSSPYIDLRSPLVAIFKSKLGLPKIILINYHFKSKVGGWKDKTDTEFEVLRTLSAFGIREEMDILRYKYPNSIDIYLGDRNGGQRSSSAMALSGEVKLEDFTDRRRGCEISNTGVALCRPEVYSEMDMLPILYLKEKNEGKKMTTYKLGRKDIILDEIYLSEEDLRFVEDSSKRLKAGVIGEYRRGSDHLLSWIRLSDRLSN